MKTNSMIEYRIELYWPGSKRIYEPNYSLWVHDKKVDRVNAIPTGSKILFYETAKDSEGNPGGSKTIFASGTLIDSPPVRPRAFPDSHGKVWRESRLVQLEHWIAPKRGVSLVEIRDILSKSARWNMRSGPYQIKPDEYEYILKRLRKQRGCRSNRLSQRKPLISSNDFRSVALKDEEDSVRDQVADRIHIRKIHNQLINDFSRYCRSTLRLEPQEKEFDALLPLPNSSDALLIEAKSAVAGTQGRHQIRQAIGQLFDYRFLRWRKTIRNIHVAVLLPEKPVDETLDLLESLRIGVIWRYGKAFRATGLVRHAHSALKAFAKG
jgi:hypothetical protein